MYKLRDDLMVPEHDEHCYQALIDQGDSVDRVLKHVKGRSLCVQAGGNFGVWPRKLAPLFESVYTFEPDALNFACLAWNTRDFENVYRFQAALRGAAGFVGLDMTERERHNAGAYQVVKSGRIPSMCIDDFHLRSCDLIYLDIEGSEPLALFGAQNTLRRFKPVLALEDKGIGDLAMRNKAFLLLHEIGYRQVDEVYKDKVLAC